MNEEWTKIFKWQKTNEVFFGEALATFCQLLIGSLFICPLLLGTSLSSPFMRTLDNFQEKIWDQLIYIVRQNHHFQEGGANICSNI